MTNNFVFEADSTAKKIYIVREFNAPVEKIWKAWTDPEILDKWWGPKPSRIETKIMDFKVGGTWQFAMITPEGTETLAVCRVYRNRKRPIDFNYGFIF
jgi:uncharacterized protein YndB with AHSA1/START domain